MTKEKQKKICDVCGSTGQVSYFKGASRFLFSTDECSGCAGAGFQLGHDEDTSEDYLAGNSSDIKGKIKKKQLPHTVCLNIKML